jgi:hypothetical protein
VEEPINGKVIGGLAAALLVLIIGLIVGSFFIGQTLVDIFVILAALLSLIAFAFLSYAALQIVGILKEVRGEVNTVVRTATETLGEVQGTVQFVNDAVVGPVAHAAGWLSATRATLKAFTEPLYRRKS